MVLGETQVLDSLDGKCTLLDENYAWQIDLVWPNLDTSPRCWIDGRGWINMEGAVKSCRANKKTNDDRGRKSMSQVPHLRILDFHMFLPWSCDSKLHLFTTGFLPVDIYISCMGLSAHTVWYPKICLCIILSRIKLPVSWYALFSDTPKLHSVILIPVYSVYSMTSPLYPHCDIVRSRRKAPGAPGHFQSLHFVRPGQAIPELGSSAPLVEWIGWLIGVGKIMTGITIDQADDV